MAPNPLQQQAIEGLIEFFETKQHNIAALLGPAGSGKTFTLAAVIQAMQATSPRKIKVAAPTHKARRVVLAALSRYNIKVEATTVAALIGKSPMTNEEPDEEGNARWRLADTGDLERGSILIVDEVSMVSVEEARAIERIAKRNEVQVVLCGDMAQLKPVKGVSIQDALERIPVRFRLNEVMRSNSKGIVGVSKTMRTTGQLDLDAVDNETVFIYNDASKFEDAFVKAEGAVAVAYTNKKVNYYNTLKRRAIYGDNPKKFMPNENLILTEAPFFLNQRIGGKWQSIKVADVNDILVAQYDLGETQDGNPFSESYVTSTRLLVKNPETGLTFETKALTYSEFKDHFEPVFQEVLAGVRSFASKLERMTRSGIKTIARHDLDDHFTSEEADWVVANSGRNHKWIEAASDGYTPTKGSWASVKGLLFARDLYGFKNQFAVLVYEHAFTAHRSQGSSFTHCYCDLADLETIRDADDRQAACYVAVSRASDTLHIRI